MCDYLRLGSIPLIRKSLYTVDLDLIQSCCCIAAMVRPLIYKELQAAILSLGVPLGLPNFFPLRFASARPDWHLSIIIVRSNSARAAKTFIINLPEFVVASILSFNEIRVMSRFCKTDAREKNTKISPEP